MANELTKTDSASIAERVMIVGDLTQLSSKERVDYYTAVCESMGLNPLTRPFDYITLNGKLTLYAKKDAADQLRKKNGVSIGKPDIEQIDDLIIVTVVATDATGRTDSDIGVVKRSDMRGDVANAMMKAITKAKRRVTLSICGLGFLDETEAEAIPGAAAVVVSDDGEIVERKPAAQAAQRKPEPPHTEMAAETVVVKPFDNVVAINAWKAAANAAKSRGIEIGANGARTTDAPEQIAAKTAALNKLVAEFDAMTDAAIKLGGAVKGE